MSRTSIKIHLSVLLKLHSQIILSQLTLTSNLSRVLVFTFIILLSISAHPELPTDGLNHWENSSKRFSCDLFIIFDFTQRGLQRVGVKITL